MQRHRYLVAYDIRDPKRLRMIAEIIKSYGQRLQYSVYVCDMTIAELCDLRFAVRDTFSANKDSVMIVPLGEGYDTQAFEFMGVRPCLPTSGAVIV